jgi:glycosyltransferase involved in cell wall biosynthesis
MYDMMKRMGYPVTLVTGDFNHYKKAKRNIEQFKQDYPDYSDIVFLHMPEYKKNISLKRYYSEKYWSHQFNVWFKQNAHNFDVVFFSDIDYNLPVDKICNKHGVKKVVDIRDLRPEAFRVVVKNELLYKILFFPMKCKANNAYSCADEFVAVSQEYLDRGLQANTKSKNPAVVYLGSTLEKFFDGVEKYSDEIVKPQDEIWVTYAGTLGESYDLITLIDAAKKLEGCYDGSVRVKILGQGPDEEKLKKYCSNINSQNIEFVGFLPYEKMAAYLTKSDITINAIKKNASQSIINKVADYLASGKPMLNSCTCKEQQDMIDDYKVGLNYEAENSDSLVDAICRLIDNKEMSEEYGNNAKKLALEKFDRRTSYLEILKRIDEV